MRNKFCVIGPFLPCPCWDCQCSFPYNKEDLSYIYVEMYEDKHFHVLPKYYSLYIRHLEREGIYLPHEVDEIWLVLYHKKINGSVKLKRVDETTFSLNDNCLCEDYNDMLVDLLSGIVDVQQTVYVKAFDKRPPKSERLEFQLDYLRKNHARCNY